MPVNYNKSEEFNEAVEKAWLWLRKLPEYKKDYIEFCQKIELDSGIGLTAEPPIALKDDKTIKWLAKAHKISIQQLKGMIKYRESIKYKFGFNLLPDPSQKFIPFEMIACFNNILLQDIYSPVRVLNDELFPKGEFDETVGEILRDFEGLDEKLPHRLVVSIDYAHQSVKLIAKELKLVIDNFKRQHKIKSQKPIHMTDACLIYQVRVLKRLNKSKPEILKILFPGDMGFNLKETRRKLVERIYKKIPHQPET